jgi:hypothetical protein
MAKRFGRNQRRRMREQIVNAHDALRMSNGMLRAVSEKCDSIERAMDEARYVLQNSIALPPLLYSHHPDPLGRDWSKPGSTSLREFMYTEGLQHVSVKTHHMHALLVEAQKTPPDGRLHVRTTLDSGCVAYNISSEALYSMPEDYLKEILHREISRQMAHELVNVLKSKQPA